MKLLFSQTMGFIFSLQFSSLPGQGGVNEQLPGTWLLSGVKARLKESPKRND